MIFKRSISFILGTLRSSFNQHHDPITCREQTTEFMRAPPRSPQQIVPPIRFINYQFVYHDALKIFRPVVSTHYSQINIILLSVCDSTRLCRAHIIFLLANASERGFLFSVKLLRLFYGSNGEYLVYALKS